MKTTIIGRTKVTLCSSAKAMECGGLVFIPDAATAYVEFFMAHSFPVFMDQANPGEKPDRTTLHPRVIARSAASLVAKPMNFAHLMRAYNPDEILKDHIMGTVMAVEFPPEPAGGWQVQGDPAQAPGIRAVAALHKNAVGVASVIDSWNQGRTPFSETEWTVSMENEAHVDQGGFLVQTSNGGAVRDLEPFAAATPDDFKALGWCYVPWADAPADLRACLKAGNEMGLENDYHGLPTLFLNGGLDGSIFFFGVALTPAGKESAARVGRIYADGGHVAVNPGFDAVADFARRMGGMGGIK